MRYSVLLHLFFCFGCLSAQPSLEKANAAYTGENFSAAAATYDSLRQEGLVSADLYLRQGNAYFESGELGRAVLAYERGLRLRPGHAALKNNLAFVEGQLPQQLADLPGFFLLRWWKWLGSRLGTTTLSVMALIAWWVAVGSFAIWYFRRGGLSDRRRFILLPAAGLTFCLAILFFVAAQHRAAELERTDLAVLVAPNAALRVAPGPEATLEREIATGLRLRIVDVFKDDYVKVELRDGKQGWLPRSVLEII